RLDGGAVRRLPLAAAGLPARRDARLRDGRKAAAARARRSRAARHPGDVRLQERQVAAADQPRPTGAAGVLGGAGLRPERLGGPLERIRDVKAGYVKRFSPVERLLHWVNAIGFFFLLATGLILYLPRLSELVSRRQFIQSIHFWGGVAWLGALIAVVFPGGALRPRARH